MADVKVPKTGISAEQAADVLRRDLGDGYRVEPEGVIEVNVRKGLLGRVKVILREEADGTLFEVRSQAFTPLMALMSMGLSKRAAEAISTADEFRQ